jgi:hypothetical protein
VDERKVAESQSNEHYLYKMMIIINFTTTTGWLSASFQAKIIKAGGA